MSTERITILLAGDAMLVRPWSHDRDPAFSKLVETVRAADIAIMNLETVIHEFKGYGQADCGGTYMHSPPAIATELEWAGFDLVANANNHAFDYGSSALMETIAHVRGAGLDIAGAGKDLQEARAPRFIRRKDCDVALIAMAATFIGYGKASRSRPDFHGRPGVNPLTLSLIERGLVVPARLANAIRPIAKRLGIPIREGRRFRRFHGRQLLERDRIANLEAISAAARDADIVVVSIHAHLQGAWLERFAAQAIDHGADVVFVHGPHEVGAIELRSGKPNFYCLGDFAYETEQIEKYPSDLYEKYDLGDDATPGELRAAATPMRELEREHPEAFEGVVPTLEVAAGRIERFRLHPVDLRFHSEGDGRGRPRIAAPELGRKIVSTMTERSRKYGTKIRYDAATNRGEIDCAPR